MNSDNEVAHMSWYLHCAAGACSGALTRMFGQPFDVVKIRFQLQVEPISKKSIISKYKTIPQAMYLISKEEGLKALWKGHLPGQLLSITYGLTQFVMFEKTYKYSLEINRNTSTNYDAHFISGVIASTTASIISYPFDVMRTRLVAQKSNQLYTNMRHTATSIYQTEGIVPFYRGLLPTLLLSSIQGGLVFTFYSVFTNLLLTNTSTNKSQKNDNLNGLKQFTSGFLSGILSKTCVYPLDISKKRLQLQDFVESRNSFGEKFVCKGLVNCIRNTIMKESFFGLFKGLAPSLLKAGFVTALNFTFYEQSLRFFHNLVDTF
ncbi:mitochondrial thiamine pyrophosphate carrier-like [Adelges cooleyi]|uniref:mitochondrial thiamine pyrophosphate carrier-like n=1 Tax=Adelges cooleyi TaxID=133065 RepID=UPI00217FA5DA|nr:mitochondrial thiamine pyrophosphate carrier-like [Adelges cooleyi]XP_050438794.1 mitochondrial thiamine pyrophosphate carrier-like [Adelges cooleyi]XP_050438795.1 mitochondrial thiamine pyrophosphate carrier-like [Adelges cooleyi]